MRIVMSDSTSDLHINSRNIAVYMLQALNIIVFTEELPAIAKYMSGDLVIISFLLHNHQLYLRISVSLINM